MTAAIVTHTGKTRLAGVIGWPVSHSRSPKLHGYWLQLHGIDGAYLPLPVRPEQAHAAIRALPALGFAGVNVTVPHKEAALAAVDRATPQARRIGAVNTIVVAADGSLDGSNSDAFGFLENLRLSAPAWRAADGPAVLLGAGGSARAIAAALVDAGVPELRLVNRTVARAEKLAADIGGPIRPWSWEQGPAALKDARLLVNSTTLGLKGQPALEIDLAPLPPAAVVCDIVYLPLETPLLAAARKRGLAAVDGLGMLLHQARPGFAAWFGVEPQVTPELRRFLLADLAF
ncbi:MAG TPA: shikimate dehydrogenase [Dongiaceae bacterium]|jgi:shikimate dehydrogenase